MLYISAEDNALAPGTAEMHMQELEELTVILPDGTEIYVSGNGEVRDSQGLEMRVCP